MRLPPLESGRLIRRYKRFLADVRLEGGETVTAHCANSGSMMGLCAPDSEVRLSRADAPGRKLAWTWELVHADGAWVGIHTGRTNALAREGIEDGTLAELAGYAVLKPEVSLPDGTRLDFLLTGEGCPPCYVEVKSVTLRQEGEARFPDAVTVRGLKHVERLIDLRRAGCRAVLLFIVQRGDCALFRPADGIDPAYGAGLRRAAAAGVEILARRCRVAMDEIRVERPLPFDLA
ncbi:MAG: DNA/RNA nuclease SfsA [Magnetococcales bacterium]|nr:DNA/RNA nuclease SfsA [Magnetococcales bacterium]